MREITKQLLDRGVVMPAPETVFLDESIRPERVAPGAVIHPGCRLSGSRTAVGPGCVLGEEGPLVLEDGVLERNVSLKGGYVAGSVFLDGASMGSAAHIRPGCLLEEGASGAHAVGLKQTLFMPFVTAGSLINFCDVLMAGGTGRKDHGEIGSSYIHFNYTPHQDKATASLIGDVPRGVLLNRPPVFLGGQGGLVGPARIGFGNVIPAGIVFRGDALEEGRILQPVPRGDSGSRPFRQGVYGRVGRMIRNNLVYFGNLLAWRLWYRRVRSPAMRGDAFAQWACEGAIGGLDLVLKERLKWLDALASTKFPASLEALREAEGNAEARAEQAAFVERWPVIRDDLLSERLLTPGEAHAGRFLERFGRAEGDGYVARVQALDSEAQGEATAWLQAIVDKAAFLWTEPAR